MLMEFSCSSPAGCQLFTYFPMLQHCSLRSLRHGGGSFSQAMEATSRKEINWKQVPAEQQQKLSRKGWEHWQTWLDHGAVKVLDEKASGDLERSLVASHLFDEILRMRWILTDKGDGQVTASKLLPEEPDALLIAPGYQDAQFQKAELRVGRLDRCSHVATCAVHSETVYKPKRNNGRYISKPTPLPLEKYI